MTPSTRTAVPAVRTEPARLLARADAELVTARLSPDPADRFEHAHLAAIRSAAAIIALRGVPARRSRSRTVWELLAEAEPDLGPWSAYFAGGARARADLDAGRFDAVDSAHALELVACAEDFRDEVAILLDPAVGFPVLPRSAVAS